MKNRNNRQNQNQQGNKPRQNPRAVIEAIPFMAEINVHSEEDYVKITVAEYAELTANATLLDVVKRMITLDSCGTYIQNSELRAILGMPEKKEAD